jgi:hypothetical protein
MRHAARQEGRRAVKAPRSAAAAPVAAVAEDLRDAVESARLVMDYLRREALGERERVSAASAAHGLLRLVSRGLKDLADRLRQP